MTPLLWKQNEDFDWKEDSWRREKKMKRNKHAIHLHWDVLWEIYIAASISVTQLYHSHEKKEKIGFIAATCIDNFIITTTFKVVFT